MLCSVISECSGEWPDERDSDIAGASIRLHEYRYGSHPVRIRRNRLSVTHSRLLLRLVGSQTALDWSWYLFSLPSFAVRGRAFLRDVWNGSSRGRSRCFWGSDLDEEFDCFSKSRWLQIYLNESYFLKASFQGDIFAEKHRVIKIILSHYSFQQFAYKFFPAILMSIILKSFPMVTIIKHVKYIHTVF